MYPPFEFSQAGFADITSSHCTVDEHPAPYMVNIFCEWQSSQVVLIRTGARYWSSMVSLFPSSDLSPETINGTSFFSKFFTTCGTRAYAFQIYDFLSWLWILLTQVANFRMNMLTLIAGSLEEHMKHVHSDPGPNVDGWWWQTNRSRIH